MKLHDWGFVRASQRKSVLIEICWRCGVVSATDADGTFRLNVNDGQKVPEDCDETIVLEVHST